MGQDEIRREKKPRDRQQRKGQIPEAHCYLEGAEKGRINKEDWKRAASEGKENQELWCHTSLENEVFQK